MYRSLPASQAAGQIVEAAESQPGLALEPLARMLGGSYALMFRMRVADNRIEDAACHGVDTGYVSRLREAGREQLLPPWLSQLQSGSVIDRAAYGSDRQFARTAFYNHVIRPEGRFHCVIATPLNVRDHRLHLVIGRPSHLPGFDAGDMQLFQCMLPLVNEIVQTRAELADSEARARGALGISEALPYPVLVADVRGRVHYANHPARQLVALGGALAIDGDARLRSDTASNDQKLRQAFATVVRTDIEQTITLDTAKGERGLRLRVRRTDEESSGTGRHPIFIVLTAEEHGKGITDEQLAAVAQKHGLTGREAALLSRLMRGSHLKDACRELGVSYNTGRSHLRQIFGKTEVHRQSDLVRVCLVGRLITS